MCCRVERQSELTELQFCQINTSVNLSALVGNAFTVTALLLFLRIYFFICMYSDIFWKAFNILYFKFIYVFFFVQIVMVFSFSRFIHVFFTCTWILQFVFLTLVQCCFGTCWLVINNDNIVVFINYSEIILCYSKCLIFYYFACRKNNVAILYFDVHNCLW